MSVITETLMYPKNLDVGSLEFSEPKKMGESGAKMVYVNVNRNKILLHTPKMRMPYGLNKYEEAGKPTKYSVDMSFSDVENNKDIKALYDKILEFDKRIIEEASKSSLAWFKKKSFPNEIATELYSSAVKYSKDKETGERNDKYPPTLNVKLPYYDGGFKCNVYNSKKEEIDATEVEGSFHKGQDVTAIIECNGLWFAGGKYGTSWKVKQLKLGETKKTNTYAFRDDDDEE